MNKYKVCFPESFYSVWSVEATSEAEADVKATVDRMDYLKKNEYIRFGNFIKGLHPQKIIDVTLAESFKSKVEYEIKHDRHTKCISMRGKFCIAFANNNTYSMPKIIQIYEDVFKEEPKVKLSYKKSIINGSSDEFIILEFENIYF